MRLSPEHLGRGWGKEPLELEVIGAEPVQKAIIGMLPGPWEADVLARGGGWAELASEGPVLQPASC